MTDQVIPDAAVEAALKAWKETPVGGDALMNALSAALPHIQAQTLDEAVDAFPLETIRAPDNAVVWMHRRAQDIRSNA